MGGKARKRKKKNMKTNDETTRRRGVRLSDCSDVLSVHELAGVLRVSERTARAFIRDGLVSARKVSGSWKVPKKAVLAMLGEAEDPEEGWPVKPGGIA